MLLLSFTEVNNTKAINYEATFTSLDESTVLNYLKFVNLDDTQNQHIVPITEVNNSDGFTYIKTGIINGSFGSYDTNELNYAYYYILLRNSDLAFCGGNKVLGYNKENSYIELTHASLFSTESYNKLNNYFISAFDTAISTAEFLSNINPSISVKSLWDQIQELLGLAPIGKASASGKLTGNYYCAIVRDSSKEPGLADGLAHTILKDQYLTYIWNREEKFNEDSLNNIDFVIYITDKEDVEYTHKNHIKVGLGFYSCGKKILNNIAEIQRKLDEAGVPSREEEVKQMNEEKEKQFKESLKKSKCSGPKEDGSCCGSSGNSESPEDSGCCGGSQQSSEDSGCCGGSKKSSEDSGCCGGSKKSSEDSGCCGGSKKSQEPKKGCCGGSKKRLVIEAVEQEQKEESKGCCRGRSGDSCCKTAPEPISDCCGGDCKK